MTGKIMEKPVARKRARVAVELPAITKQNTRKLRQLEAVSGERSQDHWSSSFSEAGIACTKAHSMNTQLSSYSVDLQRCTSLALVCDSQRTGNTEAPGTIVMKRKALSEIYDQPVSGREGWWRTYIRETPIPGSYEMESQGLFYDIDKKQNTYRFKSDGRKINPLPHYKGPLPSPGEYEHTTFLDSLQKRPGTYNFKTGERHQHDFLNFGLKDKDINISPSAYGVENYLTLTVDRQPSKHPMFKSQAKRFPTIQFKPKDGPAPGNYEQQDIIPSKVVVSSCFKSKTPRFSSSHTRVPGPGTYDSTSQYPYKGTVAKMGRQHGLFFSSAFQA